MSLPSLGGPSAYEGRNPDSTGSTRCPPNRALVSVESTSPDEVAAFLERQATLSRGKRRYASGDDRLPLDFTSPIPHDLPKLAETLHSLKSRDEGLSLLSSASLTRRELEGLGFSRHHNRRPNPYPPFCRFSCSIGEPCKEDRTRTPAFLGAALIPCNGS